MRTPAERQTYLAALCRAIPYHIVEAVLERPDEESLAQELFEASVLGVDLVGFTAMCEQLAGDSATGLSGLTKTLDHLFELLEVRAVFPYGGYIVQFGGDAMAVVFRGEDHRKRAVATALTMQRLVRNETVDGQPLAVRIGLASGEVHWQVLGDIARRVPSMSGPAPHKAIALQRITDPGQISMDHEMAQAMGDDVILRKRRDDLRVFPKGLKEWPERVGIDPLDERLELQTEAKIRMLEPFLPEPMAVRMRSAPEGWRLAPEIRRIVILFAEFVGFEERAENLEISQNISRSLLRAFRRYDGVVLKAVVTGTGHRVLVLFGLHRPAENDAERAVLAGLEAQTRVMGVTPRDMKLEVRIGIHTGNVYVGAVGASYKHDFTVIGDAVNVAARLAQEAEPSEVRITQSIYDSVAGDFQTTPAEPMTMEGRETKPTYVVNAAAEGRSHYLRERANKRFCAGRDDETEALREIIDQAFAGEGALVGITGDAGTGKSALLSNLVDAWLERGGLGVVGRCRYATQTQPLVPVIQMFSAFLGLTGVDDPERRVDRIRAGLSRYDLGEGLGEFLALLQPVERQDNLPESLVDLADMHARERVLSAIIKFIEQRVSQVRALYVLEDLQFADTLTLQLVRRLAAMDRDNGFLFVSTYRPVSHLQHVRDTFDVELHLGNLSLEAAIELICHELDAASVDGDLAAFLWTRTEGNPEHLYQILRFLSDRLLIHVKDGVLVAAKPGISHLDEVVPRNWSHVVLARLEGLGEIERRLLRAASAIGQQFDDAMLKEVSGIQGDDELVDTALAALEASQVIAIEDDGGPAYRFRDDATRAIAYSLIPEEERLAVHRRIADALEKRPTSANRGAAAALAHHRERAGQLEEAARWYQEVARMAARSGMDREASHYAERWQDVVGQLDENHQPDKDDSAQVALLKLIAVARQGRPADTIRLARRISLTYPNALDAQGKSIVDLLLGEAEIDSGLAAEARTRLDRLYADEAQSVAVRCDAAHLIARIHQHAHETDAAMTWCERTAELAAQDTYRGTRSKCLKGDILLVAGDRRGARKAMRAALQDAEQANRARLQAMALRSLGCHSLMTLSFMEALDQLNKAIDIDHKIGNVLGEGRGRALLGAAFVFESHYDAALKSLESALALAQEVGDELTRATCMTHVGAVIAMTTNVAEGKKLVTDGFELAGQFGLTSLQISSRLHLLRIAVTEEDKDTANALLAELHTHQKYLKLPLLQRVVADLNSRTKQI